MSGVNLEHNIHIFLVIYYRGGKVCFLFAVVSHMKGDVLYGDISGYSSIILSAI